MARLRSSLKVEEGVPSTPDGRYYTSYLDNIFKGRMNDEHRKQFEEADGNELEGKACAVASSSMLAYNFFHWISETHPLILKINDREITFDCIRFEDKFKCIKGRRQSNMDVVLESKESKVMLCIESKFTETFYSSKFEIADAYYDPQNCNGIEWKDVIDACKKLTFDDNDKWYKHGIKQNISHLVALNNSANVEKFKGYTVYFINILFEPEKDKYAADHERYNQYIRTLEEFKKIIEGSQLKVKFNGWMNYRTIFNAIEDSTPEDKEEYIHFLESRYMCHHSEIETNATTSQSRN